MSARRIATPLALLGMIVGIHVVWYKLQYYEDFSSGTDVHMPFTLKFLEKKQNENKDVKQDENKDIKQS